MDIFSYKTPRKVMTSRKSYCDYFLSDLKDKGDKIFKNGPNRICGLQPLKNSEVIWSILTDHKNRPDHFKFLKAVFHKFYLVHS